MGGGSVADRRVTALLDPLRRTAGVSWSAAVTVTLEDQRVIADSLDPDAVLPTASIGKLFLLATVLDEIEQGRLDRRRAARRRQRRSRWPIRACCSTSTASAPR